MFDIFSLPKKYKYNEHLYFLCVCYIPNYNVTDCTKKGKYVEKVALEVQLLP